MYHLSKLRHAAWVGFRSNRPMVLAHSTASSPNAAPFSSVAESGRKLFDSILKKTVKADDHMSELLDKEGEAQDAAAKSGLDDNEEDEWVDMFDPVTREWNGPRYGEPTKFGDWQRVADASAGYVFAYLDQG